MLRLAVFNVVPTLIELLLVTAIIWHLFDWRFAAITFGAVVSYAGFTMSFAAWRSRIRRAMNDTDNDASTKALDSLLNYETVKYFGNEPHEVARYDGALARYERAAVRVQVSLNMLNIGQAFIIAFGLTLIMLMAAREVRDGSMTVGQFVLVNTYLMQLYQPLGFLGMVYMTIKQGLVDMEQMFRLLEVEREIADRPDAKALAAHLSDGPAGEVRFEGVQFGYRPDRAILKGVDFTVPAGRKLAIVGPTGAGKSTISRLLFRFYDVTQGRIRIDGQDIRDVTQESLRAAIGVVPQDTVLFNDTIRYNIAYGRVGATQDEIEHAARSGAGARLHRLAAGGLRHARRRARPEAVGRREAARGDRAHHPEGPAHPDPGRGDQCAGHADRAGHPGGAARGGAASHHAGDRASAVHRGGCRRDHRAARRPRGGARAAHGAAGARRAVCTDVGAAGRAGDGNRDRGLRRCRR